MDGEWKERRSQCRVLCSSRVYLVVETFLPVCHEMAEPPRSPVTLPTNPIKKTLRQGNANKILILLTLLVRAALYHPLQFFMKGGLSLDYHLTSFTHSSYQMLPCDMLCVFPRFCDSMGCFLPLRLPPLPSTHKHIDHVSHKVHSADGDCWLRGKKPPHDSGSGPLQKTTFSLRRGKQTMLCRPYRGSLPLLLKALTPSCLSTSPKLWTIVPCMPALVTSLP